MTKPPAVVVLLFAVVAFFIVACVLLRDPDQLHPLQSHDNGQEP